METVVRIQFGSHLYGTNTPQSDLDFKAVHLPDARDILLQRVSNSVHNKLPKPEGQKNQPGDVDEESYSLQRYLQLLAGGQTVAIDMLFAPWSNIQESTDLWLEIVHNKNRFLSKKSAAFVGYCRQQASKYGIKGSRVAAAKDASEFFTKMYDTYGSQVKVRDIKTYGMDTLLGEHSQYVKQRINSAGDEGWFIEVCNRKVSFDSTVKQAAEVYTRIYENYGDRAKKAQDNEGVDWKALSHAVRVGREALELLSTGHITFPLQNREHILHIKQGLLSYAQVSEEIEQLLVEVEEASQKSILPESPDYQFIDDLVANVHRSLI